MFSFSSLAHDTSVLALLAKVGPAASWLTTPIIIVGPATTDSLLSTLKRRAGNGNAGDLGAKSTNCGDRMLETRV
jgi:hypothetical protein